MFRPAKMSPPNNARAKNTRAKSDRTSAKSRQSRPLAMETLQNRELMAADINLFNGGNLSVVGDSANEEISIRTTYQIINSRFGTFLRAEDYHLKVKNLATGSEQNESFDVASVSRIYIDGGRGDDTINLRSLNFNGDIIVFGGADDDTIYGSHRDDHLNGGSGVDTIYAGNGNDDVFGSSGTDYLYGENGEDSLYGGSSVDYLYGGDQNDMLDGGSSGDWLYGQGHDDKLKGSYGRDFLRGGSGNDQLLGGHDADDLEGGSGHDSLFGGPGLDTYTGGQGNDRFLVRNSEANGQFIEDVRPWDTTITFEDTSTSRNILGTNFAPKSWTDREIEQVDDSLQLVINVSGSNEFFKTSDGQDVNIVRYGSDSGGFNTGFNDGKNVIITNDTFARDVRSATGNNLRSAIIHEFAHFHDEVKDNDFVESFRDSAGWREIAWFDFWTDRSQLTKAQEGDWWFRSNAANSIARSHGQKNPREDWATAITAFVMTENNLRYDVDGVTDTIAQTRTRMRDRFEILDDYFASLN